MKKFYVYFKEGIETTRLSCSDHSKENLQDRLKGLPVLRIEEIKQEALEEHAKRKEEVMLAIASGDYSVVADEKHVSIKQSHGHNWYVVRWGDYYGEYVTVLRELMDDKVIYKNANGFIWFTDTNNYKY